MSSRTSHSGIPVTNFSEIFAILIFPLVIGIGQIFTTTESRKFLVLDATTMTTETLVTGSFVRMFAQHLEFVGTRAMTPLGTIMVDAFQWAHLILAFRRLHSRRVLPVHLILGYQL